MSESIHAPPVKQPNPPRKFPLTDMPTGLMSALVMRLVDRLLGRRVVDEFAVLELCSGSDEGDEVGCVDGAPAGLC